MGLWEQKIRRDNHGIHRIAPGRIFVRSDDAAGSSSDDGNEKLRDDEYASVHGRFTDHSAPRRSTTDQCVETIEIWRTANDAIAEAIQGD